MTYSIPAPVSRAVHDRAPAVADVQKLMGDSPFCEGAPAPCHVPVHDMRSLSSYRPLLKVYEDGEVVRNVPAYNEPVAYRTNPKLADGDFVRLVEHAEVSGYVYDADTGRRTWVLHVVLAGATGQVVKARTPWVFAPEGAERYFANVDVPMPDGTVSRVRVAHTALKVLQPGGQA